MALADMNKCVEPRPEAYVSILIKFEVMRLKALSAEPIMLNFRRIGRDCPAFHNSDDAACAKIMQRLTATRIEAAGDHKSFDAPATYRAT